MWKWFTNRRKSYVSKREAKRFAKVNNFSGDPSCMALWKFESGDNHIQWVGEGDDRIKEIKELQLLQDPICSKHHG